MTEGTGFQWFSGFGPPTGQQAGATNSKERHCRHFKLSFQNCFTGLHQHLECTGITVFLKCVTDPKDVLLVDFTEEPLEAPQNEVQRGTNRFLRPISDREDIHHVPAANQKTENLNPSDNPSHTRNERPFLAGQNVNLND